MTFRGMKAYLYLKLITRFCDRLFNINQKIRIYDLDGTIIDSSHRAKHNEYGKLDLDHWKENNTKENIFKDDLLPMYWQLVADYKNGDYIILCTAREMGKWDLEYLHTMGIYYDKILCRNENENTADWKLKRRLLNPYFNLKPFRNIQKYFYDDNDSNLLAIGDMGATCCNAKEWNNKFSK
jgi:hypothetical protein|tara:strand:- start:849 stop:1391 length:543 start_codon:yes stop_codon:yes gene_type:complete